MILYKNPSKEVLKRERPIRTMDIKIDEKPERPTYTFKNNKERYKYCTMIKMMVRSSYEYREYIKFLKKYMHMDNCIVFSNLQTENKHYRIELHHDPFTLMEIVNVVVSKRQALGESLNPYLVTEEVLELHYDDKVGLINLSITAHELAEKGRIFIPLQRIYQRYDLFVEEYEEYMDDTLKQKIELIIQMSQKCDQIVSDVLDPEFTYVNIDGVPFPEVPDEWGKLLKDVSIENTLDVDE
jgi:hypothetical protein